MKYKDLLSSGIGAVGGAFSIFIGSITPQMVTLFVLMLIDLVSGILTACVFKSSTKTNSGGLSSKEMLKGITKKVGMVLLIAVGYQIDLTLGVDYIKYAVTITLIIEETLSITENLALMGIPIPTVITKSLDVLNEKIKGEQKDDRSTE